MWNKLKQRKGLKTGLLSLALVTAVLVSVVAGLSSGLAAAQTEKNSCAQAGGKCRPAANCVGSSRCLFGCQGTQCCCFESRLGGLNLVLYHPNSSSEVRSVLEEVKNKLSEKGARVMIRDDANTFFRQEIRQGQEVLGNPRFLVVGLTQQGPENLKNGLYYTLADRLAQEINEAEVYGRSLSVPLKQFSCDYPILKLPKDYLAARQIACKNLADSVFIRTDIRSKGADNVARLISKAVSDYYQQRRHIKNVDYDDIDLKKVYASPGKITHLPQEKRRIQLYAEAKGEISSVLAFVKHDGRVLDKFKLYDNGLHSDESANDNLFANHFMFDYEQAGDYKVDLFLFHKDGRKEFYKDRQILEVVKAPDPQQAININIRPDPPQLQSPTTCEIEIDPEHSAGDQYTIDTLFQIGKQAEKREAGSLDLVEEDWSQDQVIESKTEEKLDNSTVLRQGDDVVCAVKLRAIDGESVPGGELYKAKTATVGGSEPTVVPNFGLAGVKVRPRVIVKKDWLKVDVWFKASSSDQVKSVTAILREKKGNPWKLLPKVAQWIGFITGIGDKQMVRASRKKIWEAIDGNENVFESQLERDTQKWNHFSGYIDNVKEKGILTKLSTNFALDLTIDTERSGGDSFVFKDVEEARVGFMGGSWMEDWSVLTGNNIAIIESTDVNPSQTKVGKPVKVTTSIKPIQGEIKQVEALISGPEEEHKVRLCDNGHHGDVRPGDRKYTGTFVPDTDGEYEVGYVYRSDLGKRTKKYRKEVFFAFEAEADYVKPFDYKGENGDPDDRINIIFVPDDYNSIDEFKQNLSRVLDFFFGLKPLQGERDKFNFYYTSILPEKFCESRPKLSKIVSGLPPYLCLGSEEAVSDLENAVAAKEHIPEDKLREIVMEGLNKFGPGELSLFRNSDVLEGNRAILSVMSQEDFGSYALTGYSTISSLGYVPSTAMLPLNPDKMAKNLPFGSVHTHESMHAIFCVNDEYPGGARHPDWVGKYPNTWLDLNACRFASQKLYGGMACVKTDGGYRLNHSNALMNTPDWAPEGTEAEPTLCPACSKRVNYVLEEKEELGCPITTILTN